MADLPGRKTSGIFKRVHGLTFCVLLYVYKSPGSSFCYTSEYEKNVNTGLPG